ncbi:MAG: hypothetical protein DRN96_09555, partial [Thermoproteota archaeon]
VDKKTMTSALNIVRTQVSGVTPALKPLLTPDRAAQALLFTSRLLASRFSVEEVSRRELLAAESLLALLSGLPVRELLKVPEAGLRVSLAYPLCDFSRMIRESYGVRYSREAVRLQANITKEVLTEFKEVFSGEDVLSTISGLYSLLAFISLLLMGGSREISKDVLLKALDIAEKVPSVSESEVKLLYSLNAIVRSQLLADASTMRINSNTTAELKRVASLFPRLPLLRQAGLGARPEYEATKLIYCLLAASGKLDAVEDVVSQLAGQLTQPLRLTGVSQRYLVDFMKFKAVYVKALYERLGRFLVLEHSTSIGRVSSMVYLLSIASLQQRGGGVLDSHDLWEALYRLTSLLTKLAPPRS